MKKQLSEGVAGVGMFVAAFVDELAAEEGVVAGQAVVTGEGVAYEVAAAGGSLAHAGEWSGRCPGWTDCRPGLQRRRWDHGRHQTRS